MPLPGLPGRAAEPAGLQPAPKAATPPVAAGQQPAGGTIEATPVSDDRAWNEREGVPKYGKPVPENMRPKGKAADQLYAKGYDYVPLLDSQGEETGQFSWRPPEGLQPHEIVPYGKYQTGKITAEQFEEQAAAKPFTFTGPTTSVVGQEGNGHDYGLRPDGTPKGQGFLGPLQIPGGKVASEYSVGVNIDGREMDIPTLVPTLTKDELALMVNDIIPNKKMPPESIIKKAVDHAMQRRKQGQPVFREATNQPGKQANRRISPDGKWEWNGTKWVPIGGR